MLTSAFPLRKSAQEIAPPRYEDNRSMSLNSDWRERLLPEFKLVLCSAHMSPDQKTVGRIHHILSGPLSWPQVASVAFEHHLEPFVYENIKVAGDGRVPSLCMDSMREAARRTGAMAVLLFSELLRVYEIFQAQGVPLIPIKGPVLGWLAYGTLMRRRFLDLDFFVPQKHMRRAAVLFKSAGYSAQFDRVPENPGPTDSVPGQYSFLREATRTQIELHTERTLRYFPVPLDFEKMSRRLITVQLCGARLRSFSIEDSLVMLCVHGAKHFWERLSWIVDIAELIAAQPVDWRLAMRIAAKLRCTRLLLLGLYLAYQLLDAPLPQTVLDQARADSNVEWLVAKVGDKLTGAVGSHMGVLPRAVFRYRTRDGIGDAVWQTIRLATAPTEGDCKSIRLPKALTPFYGLVRPWNLILEHGIGWRFGAPPDL